MKTVSLSVVILMLFANLSYSLTPAGISESAVISELSKPAIDPEVLSEFIKGLEHGQAWVRKQAVAELRELQYVEFLEPLTNALRDETVNEVAVVMTEALIKIGKKYMGEEPQLVFEALQVVAHSINSYLKEKGGESLVTLAAFLIERSKNTQQENWELAYNVLLEAIDTGNDTVTQSAMGYLLEVGGGLKNVKKDNDYIDAKNAYITVLMYAELRKHKIEAIKNLAELPNPGRHVFDALVDIVKNADEEDAEVLELAENALRKIARDYNFLLYVNKINQTKDKKFKYRLANILFGVGMLNFSNDLKLSADAFQYALWHGDVQVRIKAAHKLGNPDFNFKDANFIHEALARALKDASFSVRHEAVKALGSNDKPEYDKYLIRALNNSRLGNGAGAAEALGRKPRLEAENALANAVVNWKLKEYVRYAAAQALGKRETLSQNAINALIKGTTSRKKEVALESVKALGGEWRINSTITEPEVYENNISAALEKALLSNKHENVRTAAAEVIGKRTDLRMVAVLKQAMINNAQAEVKYACIRALGALASKESPQISEGLSQGKNYIKDAVAVLCIGLKSENTTIQSTSIQSLGRIGSADAVESLFMLKENKKCPYLNLVENALVAIQAKLIKQGDRLGAEVIESRLTGKALITIMALLKSL